LNLVFLHGPAASGKLTVGREISRLTSYRLFHNHLVVDSKGEPGVEDEALHRHHMDEAGVLVRGIQQEIAFLRNHGRRDLQNGALVPLDPFSSKNPEARRCRVSSPISWQVPWLNSFLNQILRDLYLDVNKVAWKQVLIGVNEHFERGERQRRGSVDNPRSSGVPATGGEEAAPAAQSLTRVLGSAETKDPHSRAAFRSVS